MKTPRNFYGLLLVLMSLIGVLVLKFWLTEDTQLSASASKPTLLPTFATSNPARVNAVEAPKVAPAPASTPGQASESVPNILPPLDPRIEALHNTLDGIAKYWEAGDLYGYCQNYLDPDSLKQIQEGDPDGLDHFVQALTGQSYFIEKMQIQVEELHQLKDITPVFNATGDEATYTLDSPPPSPAPNSFAVPDTFTFHEVDGRWYIEYMARKIPR